MSEPSAYVILSTQRTGSHLLGDVLRSHPDFAQFGEVLMPGSEKPGSLDAFSQAVETLAPESVWSEFLTSLTKTNPTATHVGFLVKYGHVDRIANLDLTTHPTFENVRIIHLVRRNILRTVASHHLAIARRVHVSRRPVDHEINSVAIAPCDLIRTMRKRWAAVNDFRRRLDGRDRTVEIAYEDILTGNHISEETISRLCAFFDVDDRFNREPGTVRLAPSQLSSMLENYGELVDALQGTEFAHMLE